MLADLLFVVVGAGGVVVSPNRCCPIHRYVVVMAEGRVEMVAKGLCWDPGRRKLKPAPRGTV